VDAAYQYDALTRRVVTADAAETRHFYFNNQWRAVEERVSGAVKAQYVWNPGDRWDLIRRRRSVAGTLDETRFVLRDYLDPAAIINPGGVVTERYRYDAFGPATVLSPDFSIRGTSECGWTFLYHAEFIDALTGLYNYGFRFYHPILGRWISRDPIGEEGGMNLYGFVQNQPTNNFDISGLIPNKICYEWIRNAMETKGFNYQVKLLSARNCPVPQIECRWCCPFNHPGAGGIASKNRKGQVIIKLCTNRMGDSNDNGANAALWRLFKHEMIHAIQQCYGTIGSNDCKDCMCREIEAYYNSTCNKEMYKTEGMRAGCVAAGMRLSCKQCNMDDPNTRQLFKDIYHSCKNRTVKQ
jgi:RHS repeat-associated protein